MHNLKANNLSNELIFNVETFRRELAKDFAVRSERARKKFKPKLSYRSFGDVRCMVIEPEEPTTLDVLIHLYLSLIHI